MCFSDDNLHSIEAIQAAITEFDQISGLCANASESEVFFAGVQVNWKQQILHILKFKGGHLPVRYPGVPYLWYAQTPRLHPIAAPYLGEVQGLMILGFSAFGSC